ncbi:MAG: hypothetical protein ACYC4L_11405 [Chloroflexota bacterium]
MAKRKSPPKRKASDRELAKAKRLARSFHGPNGEGLVIELSAKERKLPRYVVEMGRMPELIYAPDPRRSSRGGVQYEHESGDRGMFARRAKGKPVLAINPATGRPVFVPMGSPMKANGKKGLIG